MNSKTTMSYEDILTTVKYLIAEELTVPQSNISEASVLSELESEGDGLGGIVQLFYNIEEEFMERGMPINISEDEENKINTVRQLVELIQEKLEAT